MSKEQYVSVGSCSKTPWGPTRKLAVKSGNLRVRVVDDLIHLQVQAGVFVRKAFCEELLVESDQINVGTRIKYFY